MFLFLEVRKNQILLIASVGLLDKVRDDKWGLSDSLEELKKQLKYFKDVKINYYELGEDAFEIPFVLKNENEQSYISELYIIISGRFTSNAKEKIRYKISKGIYGAVHFLDKEDIENLIVKYWRS